MTRARCSVSVGYKSNDVMLRRGRVEIDIDELRKAQIVLGTVGVDETIKAALRTVNRNAALRKAADHFRLGHMHVPDEQLWAALRAPSGWE